MEPMFICFNFNASRYQALQRVCAGLGIRLRPGAMNEAGIPLGALAGIMPRPAQVRAAFFTGELLIMSGLSSPAMDRFLAAWKKTGEAPIRLKAVVTPTNLSWTPAMLAAELSREDARMQGLHG